MPSRLPCSCQALPPHPLLRFSIQRCMPEPRTQEQREPAPVSVLQTLLSEQRGETSLLDWSCSTRDPFEGEWEVILALVLTYPQDSIHDLFAQLQHRSLGRYQRSHLQTLQRGVCKIRARLQALIEEPWPHEVIQADQHTTVSAGQEQREQEADNMVRPLVVPSACLPVLSAQAQDAANPMLPEAIAQEAHTPQAASAPPGVGRDGKPSDETSGQVLSPQDASPPETSHQGSLQARRATMTIERAIQSYLEEHRAVGSSPKTLQWHQTSLALLQQYLVDERHLLLPSQITQAVVRGWLAFLRSTPSTKDTTRSPTTIAIYARSARAFCHWLLRHGHLERSPIVRGTIPKAGKKTIHLIEPNEFERLLLACWAPRAENDTSAQRTAERNRSLLWVLLDTGMSVSELCGLHLSNVDREQRAVKVQRRGGKERPLTLSSNGWYQLLSYLEQSRPQEVFVLGERVEEDHLFLSEWNQPLTINAITLLFDRLRKQAGITAKPVSPSVLRDTFAVHYLQAGGELEALCDLLGLKNLAALKRYVRLSEEKSEHEPQQAPGEVQPASSTNKEAASEEDLFCGKPESSATRGRQTGWLCGQGTRERRRK